MRTTKQLSITLPNNIADALKERVASGAYASKNEVIRGGLQALLSQEDAVERWLSTEMVAAYDDLRADPSKAISAEDTRAHVATLHEQHTSESTT